MKLNFYKINNCFIYFILKTNLNKCKPGVSKPGPGSEKRPGFAGARIPVYLYLFMIYVNYLIECSIISIKVIAYDQYLNNVLYFKQNSFADL